jgi:hypothetical protein
MQSIPAFADQNDDDADLLMSYHCTICICVYSRVSDQWVPRDIDRQSMGIEKALNKP